MSRLTTLFLVVCIFVLGVTSLGCAQSADQASDSSQPGTPSPFHTFTSGETVSPPGPTRLVSHLASAFAAACPDSTGSLVTDFDVRQTPSLSEPDPRSPFPDPQFGTCLIRVTDRNTDLSPDDPSPGLKNEYSRVQSFNVDGSKFVIRGIEGTWYLYDARTLLPQMELYLDVEPRWDAMDPDILYYTEEVRLMAYDVRKSLSSVVHDFSADFTRQELGAVWTRYEGSPSADGRYWGFMAQDAVPRRRGHNALNRSRMLGKYCLGTMTTRIPLQNTPILPASINHVGCRGWRQGCHRGLIEGRKRDQGSGITIDGPHHTVVQTHYHQPAFF